MNEYAKHITIYGNASVDDTLDQLQRLSIKYKADMYDFKHFNLLEMFDFISKNILYKKDPAGHEMIMRPKVLLKRGSGDCDDKTIMFLAWLHLTDGNYKKIEGFGFSIVAERGKSNYHHIFPFVIIQNTIYDIDATYSYNRIFDKKRWGMRKDIIVKRTK